MRKSVYLVLIAVLLLLSFTPASAAVPDSYLSTVNITNIGSVDGNINLKFYDSNGAEKASIDDTISGFETQWITSFAGLAAGFDGGMVISSDVPLASMSMLSGKDSGGNIKNYASYVGTSTGSSPVYLPLLMKDNYGFNTYFYVQNTSTSNVDVTINYSDGTSATINNLAPSASKKIDNRTESHSVKDFSGIVTATGGNVAVAVVEYSTGQSGDQLYAYSGFSSGSPFPIFPMVNENNYGYWTSLNIQNMGNQSTTVTVTYTPSQAGTACTETQTIPPGEKRDFATYAFAWRASLYPHSLTTNCQRYKKFIGVAEVTGNDNNQDLVGIVNQINTNDDPNKGGALMSLNPVTASDTIVFPYVRQWDGSEKWWTSWTIINVSGGNIAAGDISCRVTGSDNSGAVDKTITNPSALSDGDGWLQQFYNNYPPMNNGFSGGAVCTTSSGAEIVGSMNILAANAGIDIDSLAVYEGVSP